MLLQIKSNSKTINESDRLDMRKQNLSATVKLILVDGSRSLGFTQSKSKRLVFNVAVTRSLEFTQSKSKRLVFNAAVSAELYSVPTKTRK